MADSRYSFFFVYCHSRIEDSNDTILKVLAKTKYRAKEAVIRAKGLKYRIGRVMTYKGVQRFYPKWHEKLWGQPPDVVEEGSV